MSYIAEITIFPTDVGESKSKYVAKVLEMIKNSNIPYELTPMGTIIESENLEDILNILNKAYKILEDDSNRIYSILKIDYRKGKSNRLKQKIESVNKKLNS